MPIAKTIGRSSSIGESSERLSVRLVGATGTNVFTSLWSTITDYGYDARWGVSIGPGPSSARS